MTPSSIRFTKNSRQSKRKLLLGIVLGLVVIGGIFAILELTGTIHLFGKGKSDASRIVGSPDTSGGGSQNSQKGEPQHASSSNTAGSQNSSTAQPGDSKSDTGGNITAANLVAPNPNDLVSNHHPNLSGSPAPNTLTSVCTTSPGASCTINFMKDGITKSLVPQTTDRGGSTYWNNWTLQSIGLTTGSWQIQATATLNGQTKTASDAMNLVVAP